jgi:hypothetical protein
MEIDFESPTAEFKNSNKFEIKFEIKDIFNPNSDAEKLNKESYLISRLYTAISAQKKLFTGIFPGR